VQQIFSWHKSNTKKLKIEILEIKNKSNLLYHEKNSLSLQALFIKKVHIQRKAKTRKSLDGFGIFLNY
jgi:hypothetical protein